MADRGSIFARIDPDKLSAAEGARIADDIFAKNGNPPMLMRVAREHLSGLLARVFELGRRYERQDVSKLKTPEETKP
jgi:hypothetical protein